jgi:tetratricopeptide (TPR) repeat protein
MPIQHSRILFLAALGIASCVSLTLVQAQEPSSKQEAINLLRQASQLVNQIPAQQRGSAAANIAGRLTSAGDVPTALSMAHSLNRPYDRGSALGSIAFSLDYQGRLDEALQLLTEADAEQAGTSYSMLAKSHADKKDFAVALQLAHRIQDQPARRIEALLAIAKSQWEAEKRDGAMSIMREAQEVAQQAREKEPQLSVLMLGIARTQKEMGMGSESRATLTDYSEFVRQKKDEGGLSCLAVTLADMGDIRGAVEIIEELPEGTSRDSALGVAATNMAKMGNLQEALETVSQASDQHMRDMFLRSIAAQEARDGDALSVLERVQLIPSVADRADALATLAGMQAKRGDPTARETTELAWETANQSDVHVPEYVFGHIVMTWVELGDMAEAMKVLQRLSPEGRTWPLWNITTNLAESGDKEGALALVNQETEPQPKAYALLGTATGILHRIKAEAEKGSQEAARRN